LNANSAVPFDGGGMGEVPVPVCAHAIVARRSAAIPFEIPRRSPHGRVIDTGWLAGTRAPSRPGNYFLMLKAFHRTSSSIHPTTALPIAVRGTSREDSQKAMRRGLSLSYLVAPYDPTLGKFDP
jgi:hypothetical protein